VAVSTTSASYEPGRARAGGRADTVSATGARGRRLNRRGRTTSHRTAELVARGYRAAAAVTATAAPRSDTTSRRELAPSSRTRLGDAARVAALATAAITGRPP
jgi:hypothetical protein